MAVMTPKEALATLYRLREAYVQAVIHLDTLERDQWFEQGETVRMQAYDALCTLVPLVHGAPANELYPILCHVCHLAYARHYEAIPGRFESFFSDACRPQSTTATEVQPCSATPETNAPVERKP
jgi:hypothetical protein